MFDFDYRAVFKKEIAIAEVCGAFSPEALRQLTHEMIDTMLGLIAGCQDEDVVFVYDDPEANDEAAASDAEANLPWTLGHVIVHVTASSEESAFIAAEMARGVTDRHGRSRYEVAWETVTTIEQCRQRLEESRRMRLATLDIWPDAPHVDTVRELPFLKGPINPASQFCIGLLHDTAHLGQIEEIVRQAKASR